MKIINRNFLKRREVLVFIVIAAIMTVMACTTKTFLTVNNLMSVALGLSADGFLALAMTFILISGQIDLTVGALQCFSSMIIGTLYIYKNVNIWVAAGIAIIVGLVCGFVTGSLISRLHIMPYIITLGMQGVLRGLCYVVSSGISIPITGESVKTFKMLGSGYIGKVPIFFILLIAFAIICQFLLSKTKFFAKVYFIGSNSKAAEMAGVRVSRVKILLYMISAFLATVAGILSTARFGVSSPTLGLQAESRAITAAVIGGTTMSGGEGNIVGTMLGLIMIHLFTNALIQWGVSVYWQDFASYALLIVVIIFDTLSKREKNGGRLKLPRINPLKG